MNSDVESSVRAYRNTLGKFATGVTIVTASDDRGRRAGVTVNSFTSVSLEPPLVLWCLRIGAQSFACFDRSDSFCINILGVEQQWLSNRFADPECKDRFSSVDFFESGSGTPILRDTSAYLLCKKTSIYQEGDHYVILGEVVEHQVTDSRSLCYYEGKYASIDKLSSHGCGAGMAGVYMPDFDFA